MSERQEANMMHVGCEGPLSHRGGFTSLQGRFEGALAFYDTLYTCTQLQNFKPTCKQLERQDPIYIEFSEQLEKPCKNDKK